jgi:hypothetical protein
MVSCCLYKPNRASWFTEKLVGKRLIYHAQVISNCGLTKLWQCYHNHYSRDAAINCAKRRMK